MAIKKNQVATATASFLNSTTQQHTEAEEPEIMQETKSRVKGKRLISMYVDPDLYERLRRFAGYRQVPLARVAEISFENLLATHAKEIEEWDNFARKMKEKEGEL